MALELVPHTSAAQTHTHPLGMIKSRPIALASAAEGSYGLRPQDLRDAYYPTESEPPEAPEAQTIALVDAYNDPNARGDLETYEREFGLSKCPAASSSCFEQVNQQGTSTLPFPASEAARRAELASCENRHKSLPEREASCENVVEAEGWAVEISTDIEVARAVCQNCRVVLVEASEPSYSDLEEAEDTAAKLGATEISNSWGGPQEAASGSAFDHPGIVIVAAAGDDGYLNWTEAEAAEEAKQAKEPTSYFVGADYPASSPNVVAVGGTELTLAGGTRQSETVWNEDPDPVGTNAGAGGGGCSETFTAPSWQQAVPDWSLLGCGSKRAVADISADADPYTGVAVYDSVPDVHEAENGETVNTPLEWSPIGGTSVASPIIASMFALAGGAHAVPYPAATLYSHLETTGFYDVTKGGNGRCNDLYTSCSGSLEPLSPDFAFDCGEGSLICNAAPGCGKMYYDGPTGVGAPAGIEAFKPVAIARIVKPECPGESEPSKGKSGGSGGGLITSGSGSGGQEGAGEPGPSPGGTTSPGAQSPGTTPNGSLTKTGSSETGAPRTPKLTALKLTASARAASYGHRMALDRLAFSCTLSQSASVRVTLAVQTNSTAGAGWRTLRSSLTFAATRGANRRHMNGAGALAPGLYRLTLTAAGGTSRSLSFRVY
jgi:Subtilase family